MCMKLLEYFVGITHQLGTITCNLQYIERAKSSKNVRLAQELNFPGALSGAKAEDGKTLFPGATQERFSSALRAAEAMEGDLPTLPSPSSRAGRFCQLHGKASFNLEPSFRVKP